MEDYVQQQMLTYLGNKRKLIPQIEEIVSSLKSKTGKDKLVILDAFTGSAVVARALAKHASVIHANDMEEYAALGAKCFLETPSPEDQVLVKELIERANALAANGPWHTGVITQNYAPENTEDIKMGERCFFTHENGLRIDTIRKFIDDEVPERLRAYILTPLIVKCSQNTNTNGQFQAFHKNREGFGQWGGHYQTSLPRIKGPIVLDCPKWASGFEGRAHNLDVIKCLETFEDGALDVVYLDPPYNHRQYSYMYFLLNVIAENKMPERANGGGAPVPADRNDSQFCRKKEAKDAMKKLLEMCVRKSSFTILSYNNEGLIPAADFAKIMEPFKHAKFEFDHRRFNARGDEDETVPKKVKEIMYVIRK
jgi:adenine-specific DNA-methyltransferase